MVTESALPEVVDFWRNHAYDGWLAKQGVPVHTGYYIEDARTIERGWWSLRGCPGPTPNEDVVGPGFPGADVAGRAFHEAMLRQYLTRECDLLS